MGKDIGEAIGESNPNFLRERQMSYGLRLRLDDDPEMFTRRKCFCRLRFYALRASCQEREWRLKPMFE